MIATEATKQSTDVLKDYLNKLEALYSDYESDEWKALYESEHMIFSRLLEVFETGIPASINVEEFQRKYIHKYGFELGKYLKVIDDNIKTMRAKENEVVKLNAKLSSAIEVSDPAELELSQAAYTANKNELLLIVHNLKKLNSEKEEALGYIQRLDELSDFNRLNSISELNKRYAIFASLKRSTRLKVDALREEMDYEKAQIKQEEDKVKPKLQEMRKTYKFKLLLAAAGTALFMGAASLFSSGHNSEMKTPINPPGIEIQTQGGQKQLPPVKSKPDEVKKTAESPKVKVDPLEQERIKNGAPVAPKGYKYWKTVKSIVTAYNPTGPGLMAGVLTKFEDGKTSTGRNAFTYDGVAVNPTSKVVQRDKNGKVVKVLGTTSAYIPYGSMVYIPNVGWKVADDTGGRMRQNALKGEFHVDVRMAGYSNALKFGNKNMNIHLYKKA